MVPICVQLLVMTVGDFSFLSFHSESFVVDVQCKGVNCSILFELLVIVYLHKFSLVS